MKGNTMQTSDKSLSRAFVDRVLQLPKLQHGAVRLGLWLVGAAEQKGGFPVEAHHTNFIFGLHRNGCDVQGIAIRPGTIVKSLDALEQAGLLTIEEGTTVSGGKTSKLYTLHLEQP
jgi:hypothetical protein